MGLGWHPIYDMGKKCLKPKPPTSYVNVYQRVVSKTQVLNQCKLYRSKNVKNWGVRIVPIFPSLNFWGRNLGVAWDSSLCAIEPCQKISRNAAEALWPATVRSIFPEISMATWEKFPGWWLWVVCFEGFNEGLHQSISINNVNPWINHGLWKLGGYSPNSDNLILSWNPPMNYMLIQGWHYQSISYMVD